MAAFVSALGMGARMMNIDGDLGRHLTIGRAILTSGQIPLRDVFSFTMTGQPLTPHEWLAQALFALAERAAGFSGVAVLTALVIALAFGVVYLRALRQSARPLLSAALTLLAMAVSSLHWLTRPHIFTFLMLALWVDTLEELRAGKKVGWRLPLLMLVWANLHGAFVAGFVTWAIYGVGMAWDRWSPGHSDAALPAGFWKQFGLGGGAALVVTLLNPSGLGLWTTSLGFLGNRYLVDHTAEYLSPDFHLSSTLPLLIMIGLGLLMPLFVRRKLPAAHSLMMAAWGVMALVSVRNAPLFAIIAAPIMATVLAEWLTELGAQNRILAAWNGLESRLLLIETSLKGYVYPAILAVVVSVGLAMASPAPGTPGWMGFDPQVFPVHAVDWMQAHPVTGNGFNYFPWGGYLLYRQWPQQKVFMDGQTDFYGEPLTRQYEQVITLSPGWQDVLRQYHVTWVIMPLEAPLTQTLLAEPAWQVLYRDSTAVLLQMRSRDAP